MAMFVPRNRHLLIELFDTESADASTPTRGFVLPDNAEGYTAPEGAFRPARLVAAAPDSTLEASVGDVVVVNSAMIQEIEYLDNHYDVVLENYVMGVLASEVE